MPKIYEANVRQTCGPSYFVVENISPANGELPWRNAHVFSDIPNPSKAQFDAVRKTLQKIGDAGYISQDAAERNTFVYQDKFGNWKAGVVDPDRIWAPKDTRLQGRGAMENLGQQLAYRGKENLLFQMYNKGFNGLSDNPVANTRAIMDELFKYYYYPPARGGTFRMTRSSD